jgi:hypothetical protein
MRLRVSSLVLLALTCVVLSAHADPLARPGDMRLRHDIRLLVDERIINVPMTTWPIPWGDIADQLSRASATPSSPEIAAAVMRLRDRARWELEMGARSAGVVRDGLGKCGGGTAGHPDVRGYAERRGRGRPGIFLDGQPIHAQSFCCVRK